MTEQEYKQSLNLIQNSVFTNIPLQWVESFQPGIGQIIANIEREVVEWADLNKPIWDSDPAQSDTYNAVKNELLVFAQNLQKYKDDPARSEVIYDFINAARSLYSFNKNYGLDATPLTNAVNPFKLSVVSSRVTSFGYMHFKSLSNLVKFNEDLLASIDDEKIQLKGYTKTVLEPVREKLYKLITEDPEFKNLLDELGFGEVDDFIQSFAPNTGALEALTDEFFSNFNTFVGNISIRLDTERETTDLAIADARADAQESIDEALGRVDNLVADLSTYQTGVNTQIQSIQSAYESLNSTVQSNVSRIDATEAAIIQEATTRADGFVATTSQINAIVSRIDDVDASIIQEANTRASEDAATVDRIDQLVTRVDDNAAAIVNEQNARTTALLAEATARETLAAQLKTDGELYASGLVTSEANVRASQDEILGERIDLVSAEVGGISTAILNEQTARITGDEAEATSRKALSTKLFGTDVIDGITVDTLTSGFLYDQQQSVITQTESAVTNVIGQIAQIETDLTNTRADLLTETTTRVNEYGAIATSVTALSTEFNNQKATLDSLNSIVSGPDGITTQWGIKSDINGYITGVGLISSSKYGTPTSQFIVYADQFALVTPGVNGGQPTLPFFVGSEQGYLELSNTVKSNWNNVIGDGKPEDGATVGASLTTSFSTWDIGGQSLVSVSDGKVGSSALRLSAGGGYPTQTSFVPIDPTKKYRVRFWARPSSDCNGLLYFSLRQAINETGSWGSGNGGRSPYKPSAQTRAAHNATYGTDVWGEYSYIWDAADWQAGVKFFRPEFLDNYGGTAGYWEVQGLVIEEATDVEAAKDAASAAQIAANTANNTLADIASDSKLTPAEKKITKKEWDGIVAEKGGINAQATALGITTENANYNYVYNELNNYITPLLSSLTTTSDIVGSTFRSMFSWFYANRQALLNKIAEVASQLAVWTNITGKPDPQSFLETFESGSVTQWTNYHGAGELSVVSVADSLTGGKVLRIGNNSGNDQAWLIHKQNIPFDPSALYRIKFRVRRTAGTGVVYLGLAGIATDGVTFVNVSGENSWSSQHYVAANYAGPSSTWTEYVGYVKGTAATGQNGTNPPITAPLKLHQSVKYIRPLILVNHDSVAGITEVDYCSIELMTDTMNWDGVSGTGKDALVTTASTALTNANAAQTAANTANAALADIASDNKLTPVEKQSAANEWGIINRERASIQAQASALGISSELGDYNYTYAVLNDYITPLLADLQSPSAIDGPTFRDKWSYFYEYRQRLMNKMSAVAATKADWASVQGSGKPEDGATVGANSSNLRAGVGVNMVFNGDYTDGLAGTVVGWRSAGNQHSLGWNATNYTVQGEGTAWIYQPGTNGTAVFDAYILNGKEGQHFAVTPGQRYEFYAYLNAHRCIGYVITMFMDAAGNHLWAAVGTSVSHGSVISSISDMRISHGFAVAPANAVKALLIVRGAGINSYDPYVFFSRVYFGEAGTGQTEPSPWSPGRGISQITSSNVSTYIDNAALGNAQIGGNLWSTNWNYAGGTGWLLDRSGNFYGNNIYARGDIEASSLKAGAAIVDTLNIKGNAVIVPIHTEYPSPYSNREFWGQNGVVEKSLFSFSVSVNVACYATVWWTLNCGFLRGGHANYSDNRLYSRIALFRNGSIVKTWHERTTPNGVSEASIDFKDKREIFQLVQGQNNFEVRIYCIVADGYIDFFRAAGANILLMGVQR